MFLVKKIRCSGATLRGIYPIALTKKRIQSILRKKIMGGVFQMVDYQPIAELVKQIPADTWEILREDSAAPSRNHVGRIT
jgi:hypothetical protein